MNLEFVRQVGRDHPSWLPTNLGSTCYAHTAELIRRIRAAGHEAFFVCKIDGEGGYTPPGFSPRTVIGFDGKPYVITKVSHDVIFWRQAGTRVSGSRTVQGLRQFDTLASANEHERTIYRIPGSDDVSFDPSSGPQIQASAVWNEVTSDKWRAWNPPLDAEIIDVPAPGPGPTPAPGNFQFPSYGELGDDAFFRSAIGVPLQADATHAGETMNDGSSVWFSRGLYRIMAAVVKHKLGLGPAPNPDAEVRVVREEWRAVMKQNHPGLEFPPL